jgi:hypothetical protein
MRINCLRWNNMSKSFPTVTRLTAQKKGKAAYAVVWEVISEKHADFRLPGYLSGPKCRTVARIASADDSDPHSSSLLLGLTPDKLNV